MEIIKVFKTKTFSKAFVFDLFSVVVVISAKYIVCTDIAFECVT